MASSSNLTFLCEMRRIVRVEIASVFLSVVPHLKAVTIDNAGHRLPPSKNRSCKPCYDLTLIRRIDLEQAYF